MTDETLDLDQLDPNREPTPENIAREVDYLMSDVLSIAEEVIRWYYDAEPFWEALSEKLGKTAVKKIQDGLDIPLSP